MNKVIITGATSYIGIALINLLSSRGDYNVCAIIRPRSKRSKLIVNSKNVRIIESELGLLDSVILPENQYDVLYHIGWSSDFQCGRDNFDGQLKNVEYCIKAVELAHRYNCKTFLGIGSQAECGRTNQKISSLTADNPENAYGIAKCKAYNLTRDLCELYGMKQCWPRLLSAYGPYEREQTLISACINACIHRQSIDLTPCEQIWDYIYTYDVARALLAIVESGKHGVKYAISSGYGMPLKDYIGIIADIGNFPNLMEGVGRKKYFDKQVMYLCGDITDLRNDTEFIPLIDFRKGIMDIFNIYNH